MDIGVIGAGLGGLATSCLLANDGHNVMVFEKNESIGGKINEVKSGKFRFDTGPSLLTMPNLMRELFKACGSDISDYLEITPLEPLCRYFFSDGTRFDSFSDRRQTLEEIQRIAPEDRQAYLDFLDYSEELYSKTAPAFLYNPLHDFSDLAKARPLDLFGIDAFTTVSRRVDSFFETKYLRQFFKRFTTYNGSSPFQAPATLNVIPHVEINRGGFYVRGGIYRIAEALRRLAEASGVAFSTNTEVSRILTESKKIMGLQLADGIRLPFDAVVSNADAYETYLKLLPGHATPTLRGKALARTEPSCSGFVLLLGIDRTYEQLEHHNVFFSEDYREEFETIFKDRLPSGDPTIYVANTSKTDPEHAPEGASNLFVLVNAPYLTENFDWTDNKHEYGDLIKRKLERKGLKELRNGVLFEEITTPLEFYQRYYSNRGSIYGTSSNGRLSAFLRPGNKSRKIDGLYLTGGSTHPGGGIPLVILSAMHARELVKRYNDY